MNCDICHKPTPVDNLYKYGLIDMQKIFVINGWFAGSSIACYDCQEKYIKEHTRPCVECQKVIYINRTQRCKECKRKRTRRTNVVNKHKQRTSLMGLESNLSTAAWNRTLKYFNYKCVYCGRQYESLDHYIPVDKGGSTTIENCVPACQRCNSAKRVKMPREFTTSAIADAIESYLTGLR